MKKAVLYIRVSTEEQKTKGYSLQAQEIKLTEYCERNEIEVLKMFSDDFSAWKGFDRPGYNKLRDFIYANRNQVDYLLFTQWSRFSRDASESHAEIKNLNKIKIEPNAVEQWIDLSIPENKYVLAFYLTAPQVENDRLSLRTIAGMKQAVKMGRWLWKAPFGYENDTNAKLILPNPKTKDIAKEIFSIYSTGSYTVQEIGKYVNSKGYTLSKQTLLNILSNPIYYGVVPMRDTKGKISCVYKGLHEPIIEEETFLLVQDILKGKRKPYKGNTAKEDFPLKGHLICPQCGKIMTASTSKGNGGYYSYYHCQRKYLCKNTIKATIANETFEKYLGQFQVEENVLNLYYNILEDVFKTNDKEREKEKALLEAAIKSINVNIESLDEMLARNTLPLERYNRIIETFEKKLADSRTKLAVLTSSRSEFKEYIQYSCSLLSDIKRYYLSATFSAKHRLIGSIFPENLYFENSNYRTNKTNEVFALISRLDKAFNKNSLTKNVRLSSMAPLTDTLSNHFYDDLKKIYDLKAFIRVEPIMF